MTKKEQELEINKYIDKMLKNAPYGVGHYRFKEIIYNGEHIIYHIYDYGRYVETIKYTYIEGKLCYQEVSTLWRLRYEKKNKSR